jgi:hypothetical protein
MRLKRSRLAFLDGIGPVHFKIMLGRLLFVEIYVKSQNILYGWWEIAFKKYLPARNTVLSLKPNAFVAFCSAWIRIISKAINRVLLRVSAYFRNILSPSMSLVKRSERSSHGNHVCLGLSTAIQENLLTWQDVISAMIVKFLTHCHLSQSRQVKMRAVSLSVNQNRSRGVCCQLFGSVCFLSKKGKLFPPKGEGRG